MRVVQVRPAARCAVCHEELDARAVACAGCASVGHVECWAALGRCSTLGCARGGPARRRMRVVAASAPPEPALHTLASCFMHFVVVFGVLGLVASVVTVPVMGQGHKARVQRTAADMKAIGDALDLFRVDCGDYPDRLEALWERPVNATKWGPEPYLREYPPKDPWGNEYRYRYEVGTRFEIVSFGADGAPGGVEETQDLSSRTINDPR